ncbi:MAG: DUF502 domain-containing protein [Chlamydiae bacterium]|nr:DUF502 domain-containing protein [Chlamydiota bacterium]
MKKSFLAGMAILLPITITIWVIDFFFNLLTGPFLFLGRAFLNQHGLIPADHPVLLFGTRVIILIILFISTLGLGYFAQKFIFHILISKFRKLMKRIPFIKTIYRVSEQTLDSFLSEKKNPFSTVVSFKFPNDATQTLAFLTGKSTHSITEKNPKMTEVVFVPTAPHPISGFLLFAPENMISKVDISSEDVFKILLSCGTFDPSHKE